MIAYIDGKLTAKDPTFVIIETNGVGYLIRISLNTYTCLKEGERCKLLTFMHVKEDAHTLYGFLEASEKKLFLDLITISGIGPNTALTMLSSMHPDELKGAIVAENVALIQSVKGIGGKTAQRVILELRDKLKKEEFSSQAPTFLSKKDNTLRNEALSALITLGIQKTAAEKSIDMILKKEGENISLENVIKQALKTS